MRWPWQRDSSAFPDGLDLSLTLQESGNVETRPIVATPAGVRDALTEADAFLLGRWGPPRLASIGITRRGQ